MLGVLGGFCVSSGSVQAKDYSKAMEMLFSSAGRSDAAPFMPTISQELGKQLQTNLRLPGTRDNSRYKHSIMTHQNPSSPGQVRYQVHITDTQNSDNAIDLDISLNLYNGEFDVSGQGLGEFSNISLQMPNDSEELKADWSGQFKSSQKHKIEELLESGGLKLAFRGSDILGLMAEEHNPLVVEVFSASGGGTLDGDGLNEYKTNGDCDDDWPISTCDGTTDDVSEQIQNIIPFVITPMMGMTEWLSAVMTRASLVIGTFFDAELQIKTAREFQTLKARANKDYQPGQQMCYFGSFIKSVPKSERAYDFNKLAMNDMLVDTYLGQGGAISQDNTTYALSRTEQFRNIYCDPDGNNAALQEYCKESTDNQQRINKDVDVARTLMMPSALDVNFLDGEASEDETDLMALARNLYWEQAITVTNLRGNIEDNLFAVTNWRNIAAVKNVAHNSFLEIVGMKTASPEVAAGAVPGWDYMKAYMKNHMDFKPTTDPTSVDEEAIIDREMGDLSSYYAQMEFLTKTMYQTPTFYTNLYDKPANVKRAGVSLQAIKNMQTRDQYESALRREMLLSLMLEEELHSEIKKFR